MASRRQPRSRAPVEPEPAPTETPEALPPPEEPEDSMAPSDATHVVVSHSRGWAWVLPMEPQSLLPRAEASVERFQLRPGVYCVVGDRVRIDEGYVQEVARRTRVLKRAVGHKDQLLVANLDRLVVVVAVGRSLREGFLMRALVACALGGITPVVVLNKMDLDQDGEGQERAEAWRALGIRVIQTSTVDGRGLEELAEALSHGISAMMGHSGVGKSSLINVLRPGANRRTGTLDWQGKGRHITTQAEAIVRPGNMLIDLPGVREFGLSGATAETVMLAFPDVKEAMEKCAWPNCSHGDEEGCGVWAAVDAGTLDAERLELCLRMRESVVMGTEGGGRI